MKVTTQDLDNCEVMLTVEIDDKQKTRILEKAARRISRQVRIPGFRPGKAPFRIVVNKFGLEAVQEEAMEDLTSDVFRKALEEAEVEPFAQASLDAIEWEPLTIKVKIPVEPVVEMGAYRDIRLEFEDAEVTEEELAEELTRLQARHATFETVERAAQVGDLVKITVSEKDLESGDMLAEERNLNLTVDEADEESETPDLSANVIGMSAEEQKTFNHTYPEDYGVDQFAGKSVEVYVKVNEVQEKEVLELDDDFAALVGDYETLDDLKAGLQSEVKERKQYAIDQELMPKVMDAILETVESVKWPAALEDQEIENALESRKRELARQGLDLPTYLQMQQQTEEELREELKTSVHQSLKTSLVLNKIIQLENIQLDPQMLSRQAELMTMLSGGSPEARQAFTSPAGLQMLANNLLADNAREFLLRIVKGKVAEEEAAVAAKAAAAKAAAAETEAETDNKAQAEAAAAEQEQPVVAEAEVETSSDAAPAEATSATDEAADATA